MTFKTFQDGVIFSAADAQLLMNQSIIAVTLAQRDAILNPPAGMMIYRTDTGIYERRVGNTWRASRRLFVARRTATQNIGAAGWFVVGAAMTEQRNDGLGVYNAGAFTIAEDGTYRISGNVYLTSNTSPFAMSLTKNSAAPNVGSLADVLISGTAQGGTVSAVEDLKANDVIRLLAYASAANSIDTIGTRGAQLSIERID